MTARRTNGLRRDTAGVASLEFALTAVPLLLLILGIIEVGLMFWSWQALEGATIEAGRCAALNATSCQNPTTTPGNTATYAAKAATARGLTGVTASNATILTGAQAQAQCGNTTAAVVSLAMTYRFRAIAFVPLPTTLSTSACFPLATS